MVRAPSRSSAWRACLPDGRRLDVGGGTASLFWILAVTGTVLTTVADVEPEALAVLREFLAAPGPLPACYYQAAELFGIAPARVDLLRRSIGSYLVFNALGDWPAEVTGQGYDSVTAFGCFAISGSATGYRACFHNAAVAVRPGGVILGADWVRHPRLQQRDYSFLTAATIDDIGAGLGLPVLHRQKIEIRGDQTYGQVLLWALARP